MQNNIIERRLQNLRFNLFIAALFFFMYGICSQNSFGQESASPVQNAPVISLVEPAEISPGMILMIKGYRLGLNYSSTHNSKPRIIFTQGTNEYVTDSSGGSYSPENLNETEQEMVLVVPDEAMPGECQITVEYQNQKSAPFPMTVLQMPKPPTLISVEPLVAAPDDHIWVRGRGFNNKDMVEVLDSAGKTHVFDLGSTSSADTGAFQPTKDLPDGLVTIKVIETRSGLNQVSNTLTYKVERGLRPPSIVNDMTAIAPGQWLNLAYTTETPLEKATKLEIVVRQQEQEQGFWVTDFSNIGFLIPSSFVPGKMQIQNRTWNDERSSEWSEPVDYQISEKQQAPMVYGLQMIPLRAEAMFKREGKIVGIVPITFKSLPQAQMPEKLDAGKVEVFSRYWQDGKFTDWKPQFVFDNGVKQVHGTPFGNHNDQKKLLGLNDLTERLYFGDDSPKFFMISRGENLQILGDFYVSSVSELQVTLENGGQKIELRAEPTGYFKIPKTLRPGEWNIAVKNLNNELAADLKVKLRVK